MNEQRDLYSHNPQHYGQTKPLHDLCKKYMYFHVGMRMHDGSSMDGILEDVTDDHVSVLVAEDVDMDREDDELDLRQYYGYGRPRRRFRRFARRVLPLILLSTLFPYPYYQPYSPPYYPYYPYPYY